MPCVFPVETEENKSKGVHVTFRSTGSGVLECRIRPQWYLWRQSYCRPGIKGPGPDRCIRDLKHGIFKSSSGTTSGGSLSSKR